MPGVEGAKGARGGVRRKELRVAQGGAMGRLGKVTGVKRRG